MELVHPLEPLERDAADRGYNALVVEDAVAEDRADFHAWTLEQFLRLFGRVDSTDAVLAELAAATLVTR